MGSPLKYKFVIITPGRSGSEHLKETLNYFDDLQVDGEIFNRSNYSSESFNTFLRNQWVKRFLGFFFNREKLSKYLWNFPLSMLLKSFLKECNTSSSLKGFKLTLDQLDAYPQALNLLLKHKVKVIYLTRRDKLAVTLSLIKARTSSVYHTTSGEPTNTTSFDPSIVKKHLKDILIGEQKTISKLKIHKILYFKLDYETLFSNYDHSLLELRRFLQLPSADIKGYSKLVKQTPKNLSEWVTNLSAIRAESKPLLDKFSSQ